MNPSGERCKYKETWVERQKEDGTGGDVCPATHAVTHEQKKRDGNSGTESACGCENPAENPLYSPQIPRKAALSNLHTHAATGSSPVVSTMTALLTKCGLFLRLEAPAVLPLCGPIPGEEMSPGIIEPALCRCLPLWRGHFPVCQIPFWVPMRFWEFIFPLQSTHRRGNPCPCGRGERIAAASSRVGFPVTVRERAP